MTDRRFIPPILIEVARYAKELDSDVDPRAFMDFYQAKGWRDGQHQMRDWMAAFRTWHYRAENERTGRTAAPNGNTLDWRTIPDGPEKYAAYLCSPEWGKLRAIVSDRSGDICERCRSNSAAAVHHLTYIRKYAELPEDLLHLCQGCHDFTHGKTRIDPKPRRKLYLAGKVAKNCWRHKIIDGLRGKDWSDGPLPCAVQVDGESFDYVGPFFVSCDHGCYHGHGTHGCLAKDAVDVIDGEEVDAGWTRDCVEWLSRNDLVDNHGCRIGNDGQRFVVDRCLTAISQANVVMAWIDTPDCFGTLYELGNVHHGTTELWIAFKTQQLRDAMWFAATHAYISGVFDDPMTAMISFHKETSGV